MRHILLMFLDICSELSSYLITDRYGNTVDRYCATFFFSVFLCRVLCVLRCMQSGEVRGLVYNCLSSFLQLKYLTAIVLFLQVVCTTLCGVAYEICPFILLLLDFDRVTLIDYKVIETIWSHNTTQQVLHVLANSRKKRIH